MPKPIHEQMDYKGLEIVADEFTGTFNGSIAGALSGVTAIATANATDEATAVTLVNACKAKINEIIAALD